MRNTITVLFAALLLSGCASVPLESGTTGGYVWNSSRALVGGLASAGNEFSHCGFFGGVSGACKQRAVGRFVEGAAVAGIQYNPPPIDTSANNNVSAGLHEGLARGKAALAGYERCLGVESGLRQVGFRATPCRDPRQNAGAFFNPLQGYWAGRYGAYNDYRRARNSIWFH